MKYILDDLNWICIRAKDKNGKWCNTSLSELSNEDFRSFIISKIKPEINTLLDFSEIKNRLNIINALSSLGFTFVMVKRDRRDELKSSERN